jgi:hypothetical protein
MPTGAIVAIVLGGLALVAIAVVLVLRGGGKAKPRLCGQCQRAMLPQWDRCMFCGWVPAARLDFILGPLTGQRHELRDEVTTLGSVGGNTVVLADPAVSKKHAAIRRVAGQYELADLGSTNGIYVNGHKMPKKALEAGDIVRIGNTEAVFRRE